MRLFVLTSECNLGHSALTGLGRILHTERIAMSGKTEGSSRSMRLPQMSGCSVCRIRPRPVIDLEDPSVFPLMAMRYVRNADVIKIEDGVPRTARLRHWATESPREPSPPVIR
jgi:6-methylsalicylic acid synthase